MQATRCQNFGNENETQQKNNREKTADTKTVTLQDIFDKLSAMTNRIEHKLDGLSRRYEVSGDQQTAKKDLKQVNPSITSKNIIIKETRRLFSQTAKLCQQNSISSYATNQQRAPLLLKRHNSSTLAQNLAWIKPTYIRWKIKVSRPIRKVRCRKQYGYQRKKRVKFKFKQFRKYYNF